MTDRRRWGIRRRLVVGLVGLVVLTALIVGGLSVVLVERSLRSRLVEESVAAVEFDLTSLAPAAGLPPGPGADAVRSTGVLDRFLTRGSDGAWVEFGDEGVVSAGRVVPTDLVSDELRRLAAQGEIAYEFVEGTEGSVLVTAAAMPPDGPVFYFAESAEPVDDAVRSLAVVAGAASLAAIALGALVSVRLARRLLGPVSAAGDAAERMARGDLDVRLAEPAPDELGRLSRSFNTMAASLSETIAQLERARERERRFVADVSHELKTPLTALVNAASMLAERLRRDPRSGDDIRTLADVVDRDVVRLRRLVDDLLELSRLESEHAPPAVEPVDVGALVASLVEERHPAADVHVDVDGPVVTDRHGLERILGNLLDNARRHAAGAEVEVSGSLQDDHLVLEVADRGPGVPDADLDTIFDRFATPDPSRSSGTGLGLSIVAEHARRLGGDVAASSRPGGGLAVTVTVPVGKPLHDGDVAATPSPHAGGVLDKGDQP